MNEFATRPVPLLVGSATDVTALENYAALPTRDRDADLVEARFDLYPDNVWEAAFRACGDLETTGTPVLATLRLEAEGGAWTRADESRIAFFRRAVGEMSWIDVEAASVIAAEVSALARAASKKVVVSFHDFTDTPATATLEDVRARCLARGADVAKIAVMPRDAAADQRLTDFTRAHAAPGNTCVIAMGERARALRASLPATGSILAFAALTAATAPGQWPIAELTARLAQLIPAFGTRRNARR